MKILKQKLFKVIVPRSIKLIFINNKELIPKKLPFFLDSSLGIPYIVLWFNVCNKELLALRNNFRVTKKFLIAKFDCTNCFSLILDSTYWRNYGVNTLKERLALQPNTKKAKNVILFAFVILPKTFSSYFVCFVR